MARICLGMTGGTPPCRRDNPPGDFVPVLLVKYDDETGEIEDFSRLLRKNYREKGSRIADGHPYLNRWVSGDKVEGDDRVAGWYAADISYAGYAPFWLQQPDPCYRGEYHWDGVHAYSIFMVYIDWGGGYWRVWYSAMVMGPLPTPCPVGMFSWFYTWVKTKSETRDFYGDDAKGLASAFYDSVVEDAMKPYATCPFPGYNGNYWVRTYADGTTNYADPIFSRNPEYYADSIDLGVGSGKYFGQLISEAYMDAFNKLPDLSGMNNAVNAIQLAVVGLRLIAGLRNPSVTVGNAKDAWLAYRYAYGTTKSDLMEAANYLSRAADLIDVKDIRSNGYASTSYDGDDRVIARCSIRVMQSELAPLKSTIEKYGLQMDGYALWDIVPWSFIVDWFLDVGSALERARSANFARRLKGACWCSIERRWVNEFGFKEIYYRRFITTPDVSYLTLQSHTAKGATIVKRGIDSLALFT